MATTPEAKFFQSKIKPIFDMWMIKRKPFYYHVKEAGSIRGIPDLMVCANGRFFSWELKPSADEAAKTTGRIALQRYTLARISQARGQARLVHPDNLAQHLQELEDTMALEPLPDYVAFS